MENVPICIEKPRPRRHLPQFLRSKQVSRYRRDACANYKGKASMTGFLLPALMAGLIIIATIDIYRSRADEKPKRKRNAKQAQNPSSDRSA